MVSLKLVSLETKLQKTSVSLRMLRRKPEMKKSVFGRRVSKVEQPADQAKKSSTTRDYLC